MSTSSQNDGRSAHEVLTDRVYDSLGEFNEVAHWDVLRIAQMRRYLAEHVALDLLAFAGAELRTADKLDGGAR